MGEDGSQLATLVEGHDTITATHMLAVNKDIGHSALSSYLGQIGLDLTTILYPPTIISDLNE